MEEKTAKLNIGKVSRYMCIMICCMFFLFDGQGHSVSNVDDLGDTKSQEISLSAKNTQSIQKPVSNMFILADLPTLASNERVVKNYTELKDALEKDNGITTVYFSANITMQLTGVKINPKKTDVIIDGINPLDPDQTQPYILTDYASAAYTDTIYIIAAGPKTLLVRNLKIIGKNYYGPICIYDSTSLSGLVVTYERVDYNGPEFGFHRQGTLRFIDCNVRIHNENGVSEKQEFSEAKHLIFQGANTINSETSAYSIFWHPLGGTFKIADDSSLTVTSANTSGTLGVFYADGSAYKIDITIGVRAAFNLSISTMVAPSAYVTINSMTVQEGGAFHLTTTKAATAAVLTMGGPLTIQKNAKFRITGYGGASYTVLDQKTGDITIGKDATFHITTASAYSRLLDLYGRALICNDPASVLLYNASRDIQASSSAGRVYVNAEQINYWNTTSVGGLDNPPLYGWKKADGTNFWIDGTLATGSSGNFSSLSSNYINGDLPGTAPSAATFSMINARVLAFGRLALIVTDPTVKSTSITGTTAPGATVRVSFTQQSINYTFPDVKADSKGIFHVPIGIPLNASTTITVKSSHQYLTTTTEAVVSEVGKVEFTVPNNMVFFDTELTPSTTLVERLNPHWGITVSDTRGIGSEWFVYARLVQPLTPSDTTKPTLTNALVFVNNDLSLTPLSTDRILISHHETASDDEVTNIRWAANQGILVQVPLNITYTGEHYTGIIEWTLSDAP